MMYVVIENTPGYLPDSEPAEFGLWDEAVDYAESLARELEEDGYAVFRSEDIGRYWVARADRGGRDLGRVIEVTATGIGG